MDRLGGPLTIIVATLAILIVVFGLISMTRSMLHDSENPSLPNVASLAASIAAGIVFWEIVIVPFTGHYTTSGSTGKSIRTLTWPLGIGVVRRGSFVEIVDADNVRVGLVLGLGGDNVVVGGGQIRINGQALVASGSKIPLFEPICTLDVHLPSQSFMVVEKFISNWVDGRELACAQLVTMDSWKNVRGHLFTVTWPWEMFGMSRIDLALAEK